MLSVRDAKSLATKVTLYESLLIDLLPSLDPARQQAVRNTLAEVCFLIDDEHCLLSFLPLCRGIRDGTCPSHYLD
jgi:hypothetical protein